MPLLAGLLVLPLGALVMAAKNVLLILFEFPMWDLVIDTIKTEMLLAVVFLSPMTLIGLPLAYWAMRPLTRPWLFALAGAALTLLVIVLEMSVSRLLGSPIDSIVEILLNVNYWRHGWPAAWRRRWRSPI